MGEGGGACEGCGGGAAGGRAAAHVGDHLLKAARIPVERDAVRVRAREERGQRGLAEGAGGGARGDERLEHPIEELRLEFGGQAGGRRLRGVDERHGERRAGAGGGVHQPKRHLVAGLRVAPRARRARALDELR